MAINNPLYRRIAEPYMNPSNTAQSAGLLSPVSVLPDPADAPRASMQLPTLVELTERMKSSPEGDIVLPENFSQLSLSEQQNILQEQIGGAGAARASSVPSPMPRPDYSPQDGLLSRLGGGLLGAARGVGSGLMGAGRSIGQAVAEPLAAGIGDIGDVYRLYQRAMKTQPNASYDPSDIKRISPTAIAASLPEFRAEEEQRKMKLEQMRAISDYRKEAAKRQPDMEKLRDLAARAYPELAARQMFKPQKNHTMSGQKAEVVQKYLNKQKLSEEEQKLLDVVLKEDMLQMILNSSKED